MEEQEHRVLKTKEVYLLMKKDYRISRNIRASWFFEHLNTVINYEPQNQLVDTDEELYVASIVPADGTMCYPGNKYKFMLLPNTMVTFVARRYRYVIVLDLSPSISSVDTQSCSMLFERIQKTLASFLKGLVLPFCLPGSSAVLSPEIHVTVIGYTPVKSFFFNQVLVQGVVLNQSSIDSFLQTVSRKLEVLESTMAENFGKLVENSGSFFDSHQGELGCVHLPKDGEVTNNPAVGIVNMIRSGYLALQLLPENSSAGLVVITDGCIGVHDATMFESVLTQLRTSTIACTFLRIGEDRSHSGHFGHIPHTELMQFIATATFGSYFDRCPDVRQNNENKLNEYHKAMFLWNFQRGLEGFRFDLGDQNLMTNTSSPTQLVQKLLSHPIHGKLASVMPNMRKLNTENKLQTSLFSVLSVRLREGYTIREIAITKGETQIDVRMVFPWREYARFEYLVRAGWPLDKQKNTSHIEIIIEGSYDFLHDISCSHLNKMMMSRFRQANINRFRMALQGLTQTDQLLVHLQSFVTNPVHYTLPESIKNGVPLFYLPLPNSSVPSLNTQLNSKDTVLNQFASFWTPVVNLDRKVWQKWMHTHRVCLVLEHDIPLHKNIHVPNSSGRFSMVMCRQAMTSLHLFLKDWSSFVLLENQSYIKFLHKDFTKLDGPPSSFILIRIPSKTPCLVVYLAFLGGTPGYQRHEVVKQLKQKVTELKFPKRGAKAAEKHRRGMNVRRLEGRGRRKKAPLLREWSEILCCVLLKKPVESVLIRYERVPKDMSRLEEQTTDMPSLALPQMYTTTKSAANLFNFLCRYLLHQRWIWTVQQPTVNSISMQGIGRILSTLAKIRIQQGFHFCLSDSGIVNMGLEMDMKDPDNKLVTSKSRPTCVLQYILFPPHMKTTSDSLSDEEADEMESTEADGEVQIVTECWIEPQTGVSINNTAERTQFDGLTCYEMAKTFYPLDLECVSSLITFEHLMYLCQNDVIPVDLSELVNKSEKPGSVLNQLAPTIQHVPFPFDLLSILPRSQQAEYLFPSYSFDTSSLDGHAGSKDANNLLFYLLSEQLCGIYQRQVKLSQIQSQFFLDQLDARPRATDINPFSFEIEKFISKNKVESETNEKDSKAKESGASMGLGQKSCDLGVHGQETDFGVNVIPEWNCFMKSVNNSALMLVFLPASFDDLVLLNEKTQVRESVTEETTDIAKEEHETAQASEGQSDVKSESELSDKSTGCVTAESDLETTTTSTKETAKDEMDSDKDFHDNQKLHGNGTKDDSEARVKAEELAAINIVEEAEEMVKPEEKKKATSKPLVLPVYIYDCTIHNVLDSLINPWDFQLPPDTYQDMTFDFQEDSGEIGGRIKRVSFSLDNLKEGEKEERSPSRSPSRSHERRSTEGSTDSGENLWQHCSSFSEMFYQCYVKGVFQSLQKGYTIEARDIDAAINNICEESFPLETNMTSFLHATCAHFQKIVTDAKTDRVPEMVAKEGTLVPPEQEGPELPKKLSVRFMEFLDESDGLTHQHGHSSIPAVLSLPSRTVTLDLPALQLDTPCESVRGLHQLIKDKFCDAVQKWFRPVPTYPDYYFYCPENLPVEESSDERDTTVSDPIAGQKADDLDEIPEADIEIVKDKLSVSMKGEKISTTSVLDSEESLEDDMELDLEATLDDNNRLEQVPLFINFTCTVKNKLEHSSVSVRSVTSCLHELTAVLEEFTELDLDDLKITFDLNCLTLPVDLEVSPPKKPSFMRMFSNSSFNGNSSINGQSPTGSMTEGGISTIDLKGTRDVIGHLPQPQHDAVTKCMEEIELLLRDEIVSALRLMSPIRSDALEFVTNHVQSLSGKPNTSTDTVPLQFVYGPEHSMSKFTEEFEKLNIPNYQLIKEAEWYYLARKRFMLTSFINPVALNSALVGLKESEPPPPPFTLTPRGEKSFCPGVKPVTGESTDETKQVRNISPLVLNTKDKVFDIGSEIIGRSSPVTVKPPKLEGQSDGSAEKKKDERKSVERRSGVFIEGINLEGASLLNRHKSKELVLKVKKASTDSLESLGRRKSHETVEADINAGKDEVKSRFDIADSIGIEKVKSMARSDTTGTVNNTAAGNKKDDSKVKSDTIESLPVVVKEGKSSGTDVADKKSDSGSDERKSSLDKPVEQSLGGEIRRSSDTSESKHSDDSHSVLSHHESSLPSPLVTDVSIQLTKTDGRSECYIPPTDSKLGLQVDNSFDEDPENEGILKRCSSFAGFRTEVPCGTVKSEDESLSQAHSPVKGFHSNLVGPVGRFRHFSAPLSGQGTPKSRVSTLPQTPSWMSSRGSFTEDAYNADMSEMDDMDDSATSFSDSTIKRLMPNFWLIIHVNNDSVSIYFQNRESGGETNEEILQQRELLNQMKTNVEKTCRKVNQLLLLNDLYDSRMCHALLVPEADEEVSWKLDRKPKPKPEHSANSSSSEGDDDDDIFDHKYLAAAMDLDPGTFDCECVWKTCFVFHPRLKAGTTTRGSTMSRGIQALRSMLNTFSVNNRKNMFVIKDRSDRVFYLRLKEFEGLSKMPTPSTDEATDLSSSYGLMKRDISGSLAVPEKDVDSVSLNSSSSALSLSSRGPHDYVELNIHGIEEVGTEIKGDIIQMLQKRVDEATLDVIVVTLRRNPMCKLTLEDVQFIQRQGTAPSDKLHLTVTGKASEHLAAVMFYLRQNLLQYLHTPNYTDTNPENHFVDTFDGKVLPIPADQVFLYITPHTASKIGVSVMSLSLVDGKGHQVPLLQCAPPSSQANEEIDSQADLESCITTQSFDLKPDSKKPGPTSLVQFHIWSCGDIEMSVLKDKLILSLRHALCDVMMEYYILTAPICEIPKRLQELTPLPALSAPSSPFFSSAEEYRERKFSMVNLRRVSESHRAIERRQSLQQALQQTTIQSIIQATTKKVRSPPPDSSKKSFDIPSSGQVTPQQGFSPDKGSPRIDPIKILSKYETGEKGTLHKMYAEIMEAWLKYCHSLEMPAVHKLDLSLKSRFSIDCVLHEFQSIVASVSHLTTTKVFKLLPEEEVDTGLVIGVLYNPHRAPFESGRRKSETSLDTSHGTTLSPGEDRNFIAVGRNLNQWYSFVHHSVDEEFSPEQSISPPKGKPSFQKFAPHYPAVEKMSMAALTESQSVIPRQRFVLLCLNNAKIKVYTYNWTNDMFSSLSKYMTRLINWSNARAHLLNSIMAQKMGLYNHYLFGDVSSAVENNPYTQQQDHIDSLIKYTAPHQRDAVRRTNSISAVRETYLPFDTTFKDLFPLNALHVSHLSCQRDPVTQYGLQAQEIRQDYKREFERVNSIRNLYVMWLQKTAPNYPISEEIMRTLKQASRLFHYCATPLLFSCHWRHNVVEKYRVTRQDSVTSVTSNVPTPDTKVRSRHSSGTSVGSARTKRTDSSDTKKRPTLSGAAKKSVSVESLSQPDKLEEEPWHLKLRAMLICQYIKYLQSIGFHYVQMRPQSASKRQSSRQEESWTIEETDFKPADIHNLQKTVSGGILLIELSFRQEYFCVKLYTCDHNKLGITVNQQLKLLFVDECEKCKNMIHVHSFGHDFHLRCIQAYISGQYNILKPGYHLAGLLRDFETVYPYAPSFSRNFMRKDVVTIPEPSTSTTQLYEFMLSHARLHNMNELKMNVASEEDAEYLVVRSAEYALVSHEAREVCEPATGSSKKCENYNIGRVILKASCTGEEDRTALQLQFYLILTSSQKMFPRSTLENLQLRSKILHTSISDEDLRSFTLKGQVKAGALTYQVAAKIHQSPMYEMLKKEAAVANEKIHKLAVVSMEKCRRDFLWNKLLIGDLMDEDMKRKRRSDTEDSKDQLSMLTYEEFCELLERVIKTPLHEIDPKLIPLVNMSVTWYQGLVQVLATKYPEKSRRKFVSPDGNVQYHVITHAMCLDLAMLLSIEPMSGKTGLFALYRKPVKEQESSQGSGVNPEKVIQDQIENFVNACCFHLWRSMLQ